jgi:tripartite-type tricarboxylate transporter receptor subunit TctC
MMNCHLRENLGLKRPGRCAQLRGRFLRRRTNMKKYAVLTGLSVSLLSVVPCFAATVEEFYSGPGKVIRFIIRTPAGGGYDLLSRLLARHMGRHIPGNPTMIPINMPGGGGIVAANYIAEVAPKDGTILSIVSQGLAVDQALGLSPQLKADLRTFNWVANVEFSNQLLAVWHTSPTKTLEDAKKRVTRIGSTGAGSVSVQLPAFYNNVLGTKFQIVFGYPGGVDIDLAMERGEVDGRGTNPYSDYMSAKPDYIPKHLIIPLIQVGLEKEPALPDVPLLREQPVRAEDKPLLEFMSRAVTVGRPLATTPGTPPERVEALRKAFHATLQDPNFKTDAARLHAEVRPMPGDQLAQLYRDLIGAPQEIKDRVKAALQPKETDTQKIAGTAKPQK